MKIKIKEIYKEKSENSIHFSTDFGESKALWRGDKPEMNMEYYVEVDIPDILYWGRTITIAEEAKCFIGTDQEKSILIGCLESVEEDGFAVVRLGESIVALETDGKSFQVGTYVKISTEELILCEVKY